MPPRECILKGGCVAGSGQNEKGAFHRVVSFRKKAKGRNFPRLVSEPMAGRMKKPTHAARFCIESDN
jgi:hypothetical protein